MARKITLDDLSKELGLSKFSVSRALSGKPGVSEKTRELVVQAARDRGYNHAATAQPVERVVHLVIPRADALGSSFWMEVIGGAENEARKLGWRLVVDVLNSDRGPDSLDGPVHALILAGRRSRGVIEPFIALDVPKVLIGHPRPMERIDSVQTANFDAGFAVGERLGMLGHRHIAFVTDAPEDEGRNLRYAGLAEAMRPYEGSSISVIRFDERRDAKSLVLDVLRQPQHPTAFFGATDFVAITLAWGLVELGIRVPQHVSVVGSNDSHTASQLGLKLTTVRQPMQEIGILAIEMLHWRMDKAAPGAQTRRTLLTPTFIERNTTGPVAADELAKALKAMEPKAVSAA